MGTILLGILEEGLVYAIMSLGVYITYTILDFPDLSVDGTYPMGAAFTAAFISAGMPPLAALPLSFLLGMLAGSVTGLIHVKLRVRDLLSGIIVSIALYSVNLRIAGKSNVPIFSHESIFTNAFVSGVFAGSAAPFATVVILAVIVLVCKVLLDLYLKTRSGYLLRAAGSNDVLVTALAKDKGRVKVLGLALANGFAALAGCIMCQKQGTFDINMGTGTIVIGLANVIIGTQLFKNVGFLKATTAVVAGSIIYKACVALAINAGMAPGDLKLITAVLFLGILVVSDLQRQKHKPHHVSGGNHGGHGTVPRRRLAEASVSDRSAEQLTPDGPAEHSVADRVAEHSVSDRPAEQLMPDGQAEQSVPADGVSQQKGNR